MEAAEWRSKSVFERVYYKPLNNNQVGQAVLSTPSTDSLTNITLICDPSIPKCNYLNSSDHIVIASYSGLHEECEVSISKSHPTLTRWYAFKEQSLPCYKFISNHLDNCKPQKGRLAWARGSIYREVGVTPLRFNGSYEICWYSGKLGQTRWYVIRAFRNVIQNSWQSLCDLSHSGNCACLHNSNHAIKTVCACLLCSQSYLQ